MTAAAITSSSSRVPAALVAALRRAVVIDAPPMFGVSDAVTLAPRVDGVVLVLREGRATREEAQEAVQRLWLVRANLLGVVVNDADEFVMRPRRYTYAYRRRDGER